MPWRKRPGKKRSGEQAGKKSPLYAEKEYVFSHEIGGKIIREIDSPKNTRLVLPVRRGGKKETLELAVGRLDECPAPEILAEEIKATPGRKPAMVRFNISPGQMIEHGINIGDFKNSGLANRMLQSLERRAKKREIDFLWLSINIDNFLAIETLKKEKFELFAPENAGVVYFYKKL